MGMAPSLSVCRHQLSALQPIGEHDATDEARSLVCNLTSIEKLFPSFLTKPPLQ